MAVVLCLFWHIDQSCRVTPPEPPRIISLISLFLFLYSGSRHIG